MRQRNVKVRLKSFNPLIFVHSIRISLTFSLIFKKLCNLFNSSVEGTYGESVVIHIQNQILTHYSQPDQSDVRTHLFLI